ncbi:unnamed protein product [Closterium sp. NIES-53]
MADASPFSLASSISCHAWNGNMSMVAVSPRTSELWIFKANIADDEKQWEKLHTLSKHEDLISGVDWGAKKNRIVTCSHDRNSYVWNWVEGEWRAALVILRLNRAALCVAWSPQENKFAVGSGSKTVSVCYYDDENSWWVSKVIRKKHASSVTSVAWHPNNLLLATTCTDNKCRIFSATIKGVDSKSAESSSSGGFSGKFGEQLLQLDLAFGWTFGARWSPSGANLAFVGHDSTIHFINDVGPSLTLHSISLRYLPLRDVLFLSDRLLVAAGFDYNPILFSADANGTWTFVRVLDGSEEPTSTATGAALSAKDTFGRSMERGNSLRSSLNDAAPNAPSIPDSELSKGPSTVHQDCITCIRPLGSADDSIIQQFSTSGLDGKVVVWDVSGKAKAKAKVSEQPLKYVGTTDPIAAARHVKWARVAFFVAVGIDIAFTLALHYSLHNSFWTPDFSSFNEFVKSLLSFRSDSLDLILIAIVRAISLSILSEIAARYAWQEGWELEIPKKEQKGRPGGGSGTNAARRGSHDMNGGLHAPLLARGTDKEEEKEEEEEDEEEEKKHEVISWKKEEEDQGFKEWMSNVSSKDVTVFVSFLLCTFFQVYVGAKCVNFVFPSEFLQGWLMGSAIIWINAESTLLGNLSECSGVLGRALALKDKAEHAQTHAHGHGHGYGARRRSSEGVNGGGLEVTTSAAGSHGVTSGTKKTTRGPSSKQQGQEEALDESALRGDKGIRFEKVLTPRQYLLRSIGLAYKELPLIVAGFTCLAVTSGAGLLIPTYQGRIVDDVKDGHADKAQFHRDVLAMALCSLITGIFGGLRGLCFSVVGKRVLKTLQDKLFEGVIIQDIAYFDSTTTGELTSRLTNDVAAMSEPINWQLSALVRNLASLVGGVLLCFVTSWKLSILAFTTMAPILHITAVYSRWSRDLNRKRYAVLAEANSAASEALSNIRTVRAFSTEGVERERYESKTMAAMAKGVRDALAYSGAVAINNWLDLGASVLILWYGGVLVMEGHMRLGQLIAFQLYWNLIQSGYQSIMSVLMSLTKASGAAQRVLSLIDSLPDIDPDAGTKVSTLQGSIRMEDVHFHYQMRPEHPVLKGVSIHVDPGQVCALVGRSGGGKSTVVHLLMRFYDPVQGRIVMDGRDLRELNLRSVHAHMGLVAQDTQMWACSIEENIAYGLPSYTRAEVEEAAKHSNAHDFITKFPEGYATRVGERGVRLSGGQRQRIAIARMLLRRPRVLLLDEATSALDAESEALVQGALDRLIAEGGRTIVLVAHRLSTVRNADSICVLEGGRVAEHGTHEQLLEIPNGVYERLVRRQLSKAANTLGGIESSAAAADKHDRIDSLIEEVH